MLKAAAQWVYVVLILANITGKLIKIGIIWIFFWGVGGNDFLIFWKKLFECQFSVWKYIHLEGEYWNNLICIVNENGNIFTLLTFFNIRSKLSYKNYTFVVTMWLTVTKYPCHEWLWIFSFLRRFFVLSLSRTRLLSGFGYICE